MFGGSAAVVAITALAAALTLWKKKKLKKAIPWLFLVAGAGLGGTLGAIIASGGNLLADMASNLTGWAAGRGTPIALLVVMGIWLLIDMNPKGGSGGNIVTYIFALLFMPTLIAAGYAWFPNVMDQILGQLAASADQFTAKLGG